ncbi:amino acid adenylation domain-containing protein, partial [Sphingomonas gei]
GAYVPLDPAYPSERLAFMLADAGPRAILTHEAAREALDAACAGLDHVPTVLDLNETAPWTEQPSTSPDPTSLGLTTRNLAYIIYTSGSTGTPKGVMVEHCNVVHYLNWAREAYRLAPHDTVPVNTSISFDATVTSLLAPLVSGCQLILLPEHDLNLAALANLLAEGRDLALVKLTPSHLGLLEKHGPEVLHAKAARMLVIGGEQLLARQVEDWLKHTPETQLINEYGPTEATVGMVVYRIKPGTLSGEISPIGRPISNTRIYLLDAYRQPVPLGAAGEIYIGGAGVARGYLNHPELTAERFIASPFVDDDRLYKTGDLARYLPDGNIEFLGRNDHQVKIRGFRIELGEIEARLAEHPAVAEAVVTAREDTAGDKRLVAYVVPAGHSPGDEQTRSAWIAALRAHLTGVLPDYMVPSAYVLLDALPLTPNGKLDRKDLPAPDDDAFARQAYAPPQGALEQALAAIWSELLGIEQVGRHDNFFELGGHSLLAVRMQSRLQAELDLFLPLSAIFAHGRLSLLADDVLRRLLETELFDRNR